MEMESEESNNNLIREIIAPQSEVKKDIISISSGSSDTNESSSDISPCAPHACMTGKGVWSKRKQRGRYISFIFIFILFTLLCTKDFVLSGNAILILYMLCSPILKIYGCRICTRIKRE